MKIKSPFAILNLAPTLDAAAIKSAYFAALKQHPPHQDGEGFRRIRGAYETLQQPETRMAAFLSSPIDLAAELDRHERRFAKGIAEATAHRLHVQEEAKFLASLWAMDWAQAKAL